MSRILVDQIRSNSASADALTLDGSGNVTFPANATCSGTATGFGGGKFLQIVGAVYTSNTGYSTSTTYADTGLTCNITTSASGHAGVFAMVSGNVGGMSNTSGGESVAMMRLMRDSSELTYTSHGGWAGNVSGNRTQDYGGTAMNFYDSGTSASTTYTYKVQFKTYSDTATATWNQYNGRSTIY